MMTESAIVVQAEPGRAEIEFKRQSACSHCEMERGCGTGAIGRLLGHRLRPLTIETDQMLRVGDLVTLSIPEKLIVRASLVIYGVPLVTMLLCAVLTTVVFEASEGVIAVVSILGFFFGYQLSIRLSALISADALTSGNFGISVNRHGSAQS